MLEQAQAVGKGGIIIDSNGTRQDRGIEVHLSHLLSMWIASNPEHGEGYTTNMPCILKHPSSFQCALWAVPRLLLLEQLQPITS